MKHRFYKSFIIILSRNIRTFWVCVVVGLQQPSCHQVSRIWVLTLLQNSTLNKKICKPLNIGVQRLMFLFTKLFSPHVQWQSSWNVETFKSQKLVLTLHFDTSTSFFIVRDTLIRIWMRVNVGWVLMNLALLISDYIPLLFLTILNLNSSLKVIY